MTRELEDLMKRINDLLKLVNDERDTFDHFALRHLTPYKIHSKTESTTVVAVTELAKGEKHE